MRQFKGVLSATTSPLVVDSGLPEGGSFAFKIFPRVINLNAMLLQKAIQSIAVGNAEDSSRFGLAESLLPESVKRKGLQYRARQIGGICKAKLVGKRGWNIQGNCHVGPLDLFPIVADSEISLA